MSEEIDVETNNKYTADLPANSAEMVFEAIKNEYDHCFLRSERLDNKIYIYLTICAFVFAFATSNYSKLSTIRKPAIIEKEILLIVFVILLMLNTIILVYLIYKMVDLLTGQKVKRLNSNDLIKGDVYSLKPKIASRTISYLYLDAMTYNNEIIEKRFQEYNKCSKLLFPIILISIILSILANFL